MEKLTRKEIGLLLTLAFIQFTHILDVMILMPMSPNLKTTMDISSQQFGFLVSSYGLAAFISAISATFWMDRFDRRKVLLFLYCGFLIGTAACGLSPTYHFFLIARTITGFFGGVAGAVIMSVVGDVLPLEKRARGMGMLMMGFSLASVLGVPLGITLSEHYSWHVPFFMICGIGVFVLMAIIFIVPSLTGHMKNRGLKQENIYRMVWRDSNMRRALLFSMIVVSAHFAIIPYISDYLVNNNGFVMKTQVVYIYVVGGLLTVITSPLIGKLADKFGRYKVFIVLNLVAIAPIALISNFNSHSVWAMIGAAALFFIFSSSRMVPASAMVTSAVDQQHRGRFMSLNSASQQLASSVITIVGGLIITNDASRKLYHYDIVGYIGIGLTIVAFLAGRGIKPAGK